MSRLLVIGLDSADADLIESWMSAGHLPAFARLREEGAWGRLSTSADVMHVSAWPTLYTGVGPGTHGLYHAYQTRAGLRGVERARPDRCGAPSFWEDLDREGRRTIVFDAFMTAPLDGFGGTQVLEYGTWTWFGSTTSRPRAALKAILKRFGPYPAPEHLSVLEPPDPVWFRDRLVEGVERKTEIVEWMLEGADWDALFVTYGEPHGAGHYLWHHDDPTHPADAHLTEEAPHPLRDVYAAVDRGISRLLDRVADDVTVLVVSADGMGPNHAAPQHVPEMLHRLDLFHGAGVGDPGSESSGSASKKGVAARVRALIPLAVRQTVSRCIPRSVHYRLSMRWVNDAVDWDRTRVFMVPNSNEAYLRVRCEGRDPGGRESERSAADVTEALVRAGAGLRNPDNGEKAASRVLRVDDVIEGPRRDDLPDVVFAWNEKARVGRRVEGGDVGVIEGRAGFETSPCYTGNHRPNAFVAARGPAVPPGSTITGDIADLAPTALAFFDIEPPMRHVGTPWPEVTG
jgi:predicted AlkP superfamily phosphohydrolase/phosphomutase